MTKAVEDRLASLRVLPEPQRSRKTVALLWCDVFSQDKYVDNPELMPADGLFDRLLHAYTILSRIETEDPTHSYNLGLLYLHAKEWERAKRRFLEVVKQPRAEQELRSTALQNVGLANRYLGNVRAAVKYLEMAVLAAPDNEFIRQDRDSLRAVVAENGAKS